MTLFNEAKLAIVLEDGRIVDVTIKNFGSEPGSGFYETHFEFKNHDKRYEFENVIVLSHFKTPFHEPQFCSEPDVRFAYDYEQLEHAVERNFGCKLLDLEVD